MGITRSDGLPEVAIVSGQTTGFRHRARLAIRGRLGSPKLGLFQLDSHRVVHIPNCLVHHPLINHVAAVVRRALVEAQITCFSDIPHLGLARYLQVVVERRSQTAQVVLDIYPEVTWQAVVDTISPATGAEFAILPPQNASGNWVKVVQRLPVRLRLLQHPGEPTLRAGMTATVKIDTGRERHVEDFAAMLPHLGNAKAAAANRP